VPQADHFETLLESRLNNEQTGGRSAGFEILNFGVAGYSIVQNAIVAERKVPRFSPDALIYLGHVHEQERLLEQLNRAMRRQTDLQDEFLRTIVHRAGVHAGMAAAEIDTRLRPLADEIVAWGFRRLVQSCRTQGITPLWVFLPTPQESHTLSHERVEQMARLARAAGFVTLSLENVYAGELVAQVQLAPWDNHPNAVGHKLIADALYRQLREHGDELGPRYPRMVPGSVANAGERTTAGGQR
jgi:hypothetical protein